MKKTTATLATHVFRMYTRYVTGSAVTITPEVLNEGRVAAPLTLLTRLRCAVGRHEWMPLGIYGSKRICLHCERIAVDTPRGPYITRFTGMCPCGDREAKALQQRLERIWDEWEKQPEDNGDRRPICQVLAEGLGASSGARCCPGEWEPGCDLGANVMFARPGQRPMAQSPWGITIVDAAAPERARGYEIATHSCACGCGATWHAPR